MESATKLAHWESIIADWKQSGKTQVNFCQENAIKVSTFGYWVKRLSASKKLFVPVKVREPKRNESIFYKIETSLGINIIIPSGADSDDLTAIFKSLGLIA